MDAKGDERMDLDELAARVAEQLEELGLLEVPVPRRVARGADPRTVRYYTSLGLVDRPLDYEGHRARYGERHLLQLVAIKALQRDRRPLAEIQALLYGRTDDELSALIASLAHPRGEAIAPDLKLIRRREAVLAPGLVLSAEEGATPDLDEDRLVERFRMALRALRAPPSPPSPSSGEGEDARERGS